MKYLKFLSLNILKTIKRILIKSIPLLIFLAFIIISFASEGYTLEDLGIYDFNLNPNDYCNITDVNYTAILHDDPDGKARVEITEYLTFDIHASSPNNTFKEIWRALPEMTVDGLKVTYDVKSVTQVLDNGREIPYTETSKLYWEDSDFNSLSTYYWHHSKGSGKYPDNYESVLIYIPWTYREKMTFKIVYSMNNAALKYKDCSELYLSMYSGNTIKKLKSYNAQILIPNNLMPSTYHAYTFGTAKSRLPYTESSTINPGYYTFSINLDKSDLKFNYHNRYIEFCLLSYGNDKNIFTKYAPNNIYSNDNVLDECIAENEYYERQNQKFNTYKRLLLLSSIVFSVLIVYHSRKKYKEIIKKYDFYEPETDYTYFREIPSDLDPIFASELVFMKDPFNDNKEKKEEYAAILLSLVRKQYVKISNSDNSNSWTNYNTVISLEPIRTDYLTQNSEDSSSEPVSIIINENTNTTLEPLTTSEKLYLELLQRHSKSTNNSIKLSQLQTRINADYENTNEFVKNIEKKPMIECGLMQGYFQQSKYDAPQKALKNSASTSMKWGFALLLLANGFSYFTPMALSFGAYTILSIACFYRAIYLSIKSANAILFTQYGANEQAKWYGLYNFLNSDTLLYEKNVYELPLWEKFLIYATAFGVSEKVIKALKIHAVDIEINDSPILNNHCYIHTNNFHSISRSFGHSIHTSSRGGGFSGHGYGGGGRGGGGGGGGH